MPRRSSNQRLEDLWVESRARDRDLVRVCLNGDEAAWTEIWLRYGSLVKAVARRNGCDDEEVREVLQRAALVALQGLDRLRHPEKLAGWLAGIARFQAMEMIRLRCPTTDLADSAPSYDPGLDARLMRDQELAILRQAVAELEPRCRRLLYRLELKDPPDSYRVVAEAEGLAASSIGPIRLRCLQRLRKIYERLSRSEA